MATINSAHLTAELAHDAGHLSVAARLLSSRAKEVLDQVDGAGPMIYCCELFLLLEGQAKWEE